MNKNGIIFDFEKNDSFYCEKLDLKEDEKVYIGFGNAFENIVMILFSFLGIFINLYFFYSSIRKIINSKKYKNNNLSSIEKILCIISITETFISICWLINSFSMKNTNELLEKCKACRIIGNIELFFYLFDWMILTSTLFQIKKILTNPLETLKTASYIYKYILFCGIFGIFNVIFGHIADVEGVSPILTCFIDVTGWKYDKDERVLKMIFYVMFFFVPICILLYGIYQVYEISKLPQFKNNKKNRKFFKSYLQYIFTYIILALLLISVFVVDYFIDQKAPKGVVKVYFNIVTILSCSTPLIVGIIRLIKTNILKNLFLCNYNKKKNYINKDYNKDENLVSERKSSSNEIENNFIDFEQEIICKEFKKIFIAISYILDKSNQLNKEEQSIEEEKKEEEKKEGKKEIEKKEEKKKDEEINLNYDNEFDFDNFYTINKEEILKDFDLEINEDIFVLDQEEINIEVREYCPKLFKNMRKSDNLKEDQLAKFFQPKNVTPDLFIKTSDSNYYINTLNKKFILRSINLEQIEFYKSNLRNGHINEYFEKNKNSIITRVYGLYYLKIENFKHYYIALMENIYESIDSDFSSKNMIRINDNSEIDDNEKTMEIGENEIDEKIWKNNGEENYSGNIPRDSVRKSLMKKDTIFQSKKFIMDLDENEYDRLKKIIDKDIEFLHDAGINKVKFFAVEKKVNNNIWDSLFNKKDDIQENEKSNDIDKYIGVRKYIFKSAKKNIIYCIAVSDYFNNNSE